MSIRRIMALMAVAVLAIVLVVSSAVFYATGESRSAASRISQAISKIILIEELEVDFLRYNRLAFWYAITEEQQVLDTQERVKRRILDNLDEVRRVIEPERRHLVEEVVEKMENIFALDEPAQTMGMEDRFTRSAGDVESAYLLLEKLVNQAIADSGEVGERIRGTNQFIERVGFLVVGLLVVGMLVLGWTVKRKLYEPILTLEQSIADFRVGGEAVAPVTGPLELQRVSETFNQLGVRLQKQRDDATHFVSGVAHDLRNPLTAMHNYIELLSAKPDAFSPERLQKTHALMGRQLIRMNRILDDFLDTSRIEAGAFELRAETVDLRDIALETVQLFSASSEKHAIRAALQSEPVLAKCDRGRMEQVLNNLISNALKYSPNGGEVVVACKSVNEMAVIQVKDKGIGIAPEDLETIFIPFRRTVSTKEAFPGVGLGLSVVKKLVEAHGGSIRVESSLGHGSTFEVSLPQTDSQGIVGNRFA